MYVYVCILCGKRLRVLSMSVCMRVCSDVRHVHQRLLVLVETEGYMHVRLYGCMFVYILGEKRPQGISMYVCMHVCSNVRHVQQHQLLLVETACMFICMYVFWARRGCKYMSMYACMHVMMCGIRISTSFF